MTTKVVERSDLDNWVDGLIAATRVFGVQAREERFVFDALACGSDLRLDYDVTILPPKKYFLPPREALLRFDRFKMSFESVLEDAPFVLFGVHPYDMEAISQLDQLFSRDNRDTHYMTRRESATIVVSDVETASADVFAGCMGTSCGDEVAGGDVLLTRREDGSYLADARTEKGETLMRSLTAGRPATEEDVEQRRATWRRNFEMLRKHELRMNPTDLPMLLAQSYDHPVWEEKSEHCYSCGSCNLVCPTCYCFDVHDELDWNLETGRRLRSWDGCMLRDFAKVAGDHNFREQKSARYRHRYLRKGKYTHDMIGRVSCVGCGRCISACTSKIANPVEVYNRLLETTS